MSKSDEAQPRGKAVVTEAKGPYPAGVVHMREYVGAMSSELAQMARIQGDEKLACILDVAADLARNKVIDARTG